MNVRRNLILIRKELFFMEEMMEEMMEDRTADYAEDRAAENANVNTRARKDFLGAALEAAKLVIKALVKAVKEIAKAVISPVSGLGSRLAYGAEGSTKLEMDARMRDALAAPEKPLEKNHEVEKEPDRSSKNMGQKENALDKERQEVREANRHLPFSMHAMDQRSVLLGENKELAESLRMMMEGTVRNEIRDSIKDKIYAEMHKNGKITIMAKGDGDKKDFVVAKINTEKDEVSWRKGALETGLLGMVAASREGKEWLDKVLISELRKHPKDDPSQILSEAAARRFHLEQDGKLFKMTISDGTLDGCCLGSFDGERFHPSADTFGEKGMDQFLGTNIGGKMAEVQREHLEAYMDWNKRYDGLAAVWRHDPERLIEHLKKALDGQGIHAEVSIDKDTKDISMQVDGVAIISFCGSSQEIFGKFAFGEEGFSFNGKQVNFIDPKETPEIAAFADLCCHAGEDARSEIEHEAMEREQLEEDKETVEKEQVKDHEDRDASFDHFVSSFGEMIEKNDSDTSLKSIEAWVHESGRPCILIQDASVGSASYDILAMVEGGEAAYMSQKDIGRIMSGEMSLMFDNNQNQDEVISVGEFEERYGINVMEAFRETVGQMEQDREQAGDEVPVPLEDEVPFEDINWSDVSEDNAFFYEDPEIGL